MSKMSYKTSFGVVVIVSAIVVAFILNNVLNQPLEVPQIEDVYWGEGERPTKEDTTVRKFVLNVSDDVLGDLKHRLERTRFPDSFHGVQWEYGFGLDYMKELVKYWRDDFDWRKQEALVNSFDHYKTTIDGLELHFLHVKPKLKPGQNAKPLLLAHGWPGSFFEFYKVFPILTDPLAHGGTEEDFFEVIVPSIPGFGFSQPANKPGLEDSATAVLYLKLMERLGFDGYYVQGGDHGSVIVSVMAMLNPKVVRGLHLNMYTGNTETSFLIKLLVGSVFPSLAGLSQADYNKVYPLWDRFLWILSETGYLHIQATRPHTIGHGIVDSPVGMAALLLEKYSSWTNPTFAHLPDGGLEKHFTKDELLTNVMIYWVSETVVSTLRLYRETISDRKFPIISAAHSIPIDIPSAIADFPHELFHTPEPWCHSRLRNLLQYTTMPRGGHFAALEVPELFSQDIRDFARKAEAFWRRQSEE
ncbi:epoxide hydrolase 1-like [Branchiostoma floridae]|uniref:Epoxide hydrolase n=1 Tax=Branchiostoma floridae TaxID=7739 RepID=A0A9J7KHT1_BRAFL|nr:epoxide hydrolase 1-like [Branchiostoma floridae]